MGARHQEVVLDVESIKLSSLQWSTSYDAKAEIPHLQLGFPCKVYGHHLDGLYSKMLLG